MTDTPPDTSAAEPAVLWSKPEPDRAGTPLLILFHGYGSDEQDLFSLVPSLPEAFTVASVRAPDTAGPGYAWFPLQNDMSFSIQTVMDRTAAVQTWIDSIRDQFASVTLLGFSQGMSIATSLARHRPDDYDAVVGLSGFVLPEADARVVAWPEAIVARVRAVASSRHDATAGRARWGFMAGS